VLAIQTIGVTVGHEKVRQGPPQGGPKEAPYAGKNSPSQEVIDLLFSEKFVNRL
tara:strand:+ start:150 stop:311 length:162 start_codon:yes stop_codon:yes gene_type:complete